MICELCGTELVLESRGGKNTKASCTERTLCLECYDVIDFVDVIKSNEAHKPDPKPKSTPAPVTTMFEPRCLSKIVCSCGTTMETSTCTNCGKPNPLYRRKNKKH